MACPIDDKLDASTKGFSDGFGIGDRGLAVQGPTDEEHRDRRFYRSSECGADVGITERLAYFGKRSVSDGSEQEVGFFSSYPHKTFCRSA